MTKKNVLTAEHNNKNVHTASRQLEVIAVAFNLKLYICSVCDTAMRRSIIPNVDDEQWQRQQQVPFCISNVHI